MNRRIRNRTYGGVGGGRRKATPYPIEAETEIHMAIITIDGREYDLDTLSEQAKQQLMSLQFVDAELQRLNAQAAVFQTARAAYINALKDLLPKA